MPGPRKDIIPKGGDGGEIRGRGHNGERNGSEKELKSTQNEAN